MASDRLTRATPADLEVRGSDGRVICGLAVPYGEPATIYDAGRSYVETFERGAFERTIRERGDKVKFLAVHDRRSLPIGRAVLLREDAAGLYAELRASKTQAGDEVLALIKDGAISALSIGFRPIRDRWTATRDAVTRLEARLDEISAVPFPAYEGAVIAGVRSTDRFLPADLARRRLDLLERATPR